MPANPDIARVFFRAGYIENWGRGIRDMMHYCNQAGLPEPFYKEMGAGFALVFEQEKGAADFSYASDDRKTTQETTQETLGKSSQEEDKNAFEKFRNDFGTIELQILFEIQKNPNITAEQMAEKINKTPRTAENYLTKLKKRGILIRVGPKLGGYWKIVNNK